MIATFACDRCGRPFARREYLALHVGHRHGDLQPEEAEAFRIALAEEESWLRRFRQHVRGALTLLPVVGAFLLVLLLAYLGGVPVALAMLLLPGTIAFGAVLYHLASTREETGAGDPATADGAVPASPGLPPR